MGRIESMESDPLFRTRKTGIPEIDSAIEKVQAVDAARNAAKAENADAALPEGTVFLRSTVQSEPR